jgi:inorganic pyrophosphatase
MRRNILALACALVLLTPAIAAAQPHGVAHPWHGVENGYDATGATFRTIIEIPKGSMNKYEIDKPTGLLKLDRVLRSDVGYPADYGFIPKSYGHDGDPLDVLVVSSHRVAPLAIVEARTIGVIRMIDQGEGDDKILAVNPSDPVFGKITDVSQLPPEKLAEIETFFKTYKLREGKVVTVEKAEGPEAAKKIIEESLVDYEKLAAKLAAEEKAAKEAAERAERAARAREGIFGKVKSFFGRAGSTFMSGFTKFAGLFYRSTGSSAERSEAAKLREARGMADALNDRIGEATRPGVERKIR